MKGAAARHSTSGVNSATAIASRATPMVTALALVDLTNTGTADMASTATRAISNSRGVGMGLLYQNPGVD